MGSTVIYYIPSILFLRSPHVASDAYSCEVESWCPVEIDSLPLGKRRALMARAEEYTVFVKNSIAFPYFGAEYVRNNLVRRRGDVCNVPSLCSFICPPRSRTAVVPACSFRETEAA